LIRTTIDPFGAVIKNSDIQKNHSFAHIDVVDSDSQQRTSDTLIATGQPKNQMMPNLDGLHGGGLNGASYALSSSYSSLGDSVLLLERNDFLAKRYL
jgi:hypothetical protein